MSRASILLLAPVASGLQVLRPSGLLAWIVAGAAIRRSRRGLAELDDHLLRDLGLSREEACREAARPAWDAIGRAPWDAPAHWLR